MDHSNPAGNAREPVLAWIGLGSNLQDPVRQVESALNALAGLPGCCLVARSRLYHSAPVGGVEQPDFVNAVAGLSTVLGPDILFDALLALETRAGRVRHQELRWGPRVLDLDLLFYGDLLLQQARLEIPHPRACERAFVLAPLLEVAADWTLPGGGTVRDAWARCADCGLVQPLDAADMSIPLRVDG